jgi:hypothetical protein
VSKSFRGAAASSATGGIFAAICAVAALALTAAPALAQSFGGNGGADAAATGGAGGGYGITGGNGTDVDGKSGGGGGGGADAAGGNSGNGALGGIAGVLGGGAGGNGSGGGGGGGGGDGLDFAGGSRTQTLPVTGGTGGNGGPGEGGGGGGSGGYGIVGTGVANLVVTFGNVGHLGSTEIVQGGSGGAGGPGDGGGGGSGGDGGVGVWLQASGSVLTVTASGRILGGNGGNGGFSAGGGALPGVGGAGGAGVLGTGLTVNNGGTITGGNGGLAGLVGVGGAGIVGSDLIISNTGVIQGGLAGFGASQNYAIIFTGGANSVGSTGTISGGINVQGGSFTPALSGSAIGTPLSIGGPITFAPGTTYVIRVSPTVADSLTASGAATLTGATVDAQFAPGSYVSKTYTILTATDGLGGTTFAGLTNLDLPPGASDSLSYDNNDVFLNLTAGFSNFTGLNVNQQNVANVLTNFFNTNGGIAAQFFNLTPGGLTQIDGENGTGAEHGAFQLMNEFLNLMLDFYVDGHGGGGGGGPLGFAPDQPDSLPPEIALAYAGVLKAPPPSPASGGGSGWGFEQRWTAWGAGFGGSANASGNAVIGSTNVTTGTFGYAAGADYRYSPDTVLGFALAGGGTNWNLAEGLGTGRSDAFLAGVYGVTHRGPAYVGGALAFANNWFTTDRVALGDQLTANFQGQSYAARLEGGYRFAVPAPSFSSPASGGGLGWGAIGVAPYAAIQAQNFHTPAYSETDLTAGGFGLSYAAMNGTDTRSELGARFDDPTLVGNMPLILRARLAWAHDWVGNPALNAAFESLPGTSFTVFGAAIPQNSALTSAGAQLFFTPRWSLTAKFDGEFAAGTQTYAGTGTLRYTW